MSTNHFGFFLLRKFSSSASALSCARCCLSQLPQERALFKSMQICKKISGDCKTTVATYSSTLATTTFTGDCFNCSHLGNQLNIVSGRINDGLSRSCDNFLREDLVNKLGLQIIPSTTPVSMATTYLGCCKVLFLCKYKNSVQSRTYNEFWFSMLPNLCYDVILRRDFLKLHVDMEIFGETSPKLTFFLWPHQITITIA